MSNLFISFTDIRFFLSKENKRKWKTKTTTIDCQTDRKEHKLQHFEQLSNRLVWHCHHRIHTIVDSMDSMNNIYNDHFLLDHNEQYTKINHKLTRYFYNLIQKQFKIKMKMKIKKNLYEQMVWYLNPQVEMKHNFQSLCKSLNHDEIVSNEYIKPWRFTIDKQIWKSKCFTSDAWITRQYFIPFLNLNIRNQSEKKRKESKKKTYFPHFSQLYILSPVNSSAWKKAWRQSCKVNGGPQRFVVKKLIHSNNYTSSSNQNKTNFFIIE